MTTVNRDSTLINDSSSDMTVCGKTCLTKLEGQQVLLVILDVADSSNLVHGDPQQKILKEAKPVGLCMKIKHGWQLKKSADMHTYMPTL